MEKYKKTFLICLMLLITVAIFISPVNALQNYDQRIYKIGSTNYKQEPCVTPFTSYNNYYQNRNTNYYPTDNYYQNRNTNYYPTDNYYQNYNSWDYYNRKKDTPTNRLSYTKYAYEDTRKSIFGDYVKEYVVEIKNTGYTGRYFTVRFELENKNGYNYIQTVTHYLKGGEREKFVYRDIQYERHEFLDWDYAITPRNN